MVFKAKYRLQRILINKAVQNIGYMSFGQVATQVISLVGALYIPKILGPENFGTYQTVLSYVTVFVIFSLTGINKVLVRSSSKNLSDLGLHVEQTLGLRLILTFFAAVSAIAIAEFSGKYDSTMVIYISIYTIWLFVRTLESTINVVFQSHQELKYFSFFSMLNSFLLTLFIIIALKMGASLTILFIIHGLVGILVLLLSYRSAQRLTSFKLFTKPKVEFEGLKQGFMFSLLSFFNVVGNKIDIVMLSFLGSPAEVGVYALANTIVRKGLVARRAISTSIFPMYAKKGRHSLQPRQLNRHAILVIVPSVVMVVFIFMCSKLVITNLIGDEYINAVRILKVLSFYLLFVYVSIPFELSLQVSYAENQVIKIKAILSIVNLTANYILYMSYGVIGMAYSTVLVQALNFVTMFILVNKIRRDKQTTL